MPPCAKLSGQKWAVGGVRSEGGGEERGEGAAREQGRFCSFSRDLARAVWRESVCVGLGMK